MSTFVKCSWFLMVLLALSPASWAASVLGPQRVATATDAASTTDWSAKIDQLVQGGGLRIQRDEADTDVPGYRFRRYEQLIRGVPVLGGLVVRRIDSENVTRTVVASLVDDSGVNVRPTIDAARAMSLAETHMGHRAQALGTARLILLPIDGRLRLTYTFWCDTIDPFALKRYYVDAHTGEIAFSHNDLKNSAAIGTGTGTWGDHKLSVDHVGSRYEAVDRGRPAVIKTYDARGATDIETRPSVWSSYLARDDDNQWTNKSVVDGHAYLGWIYDYFYKRHGRRGLDDANKQVDVIVNSGDAGNCNAHWMPSYEVFGFSAPGNQPGGTCEAQVSGLDIVAHEYAHAVTEFSWNGVYANQSGALNEAFSDIMGASVEFFFEPRGDGRNKADWYLGEDADTIFNPAGSRVLRSFGNPGMFLWSGYPYPDHMSEYWDTGEADNGGVHYNCTIPSHAFYLFVEGGKNRTSGITVQGIGFANIEKAEKIFYRGFTKYMPQTATFYGAAYYTVIAAQELYGSNSNEANQLYQAWRAVGVVD